MDSDEHPASISKVMDGNSATTKIGPGTPPTAGIPDLVGTGEKRNPVFISAVRREFLEMFRGVRKSPNSDGFFHANPQLIRRESFCIRVRTRFRARRFARIEPRQRTRGW